MLVLVVYRRCDGSSLFEYLVCFLRNATLVLAIQLHTLGNTHTPTSSEARGYHATIILRDISKHSSADRYNGQTVKVVRAVQ